jgi:hypothetical protein
VRLYEGGEVLQSIGFDRCFACMLGAWMGERCSWYQEL